ncbi:hypothetical protein [Moorena sp. SIO3A2]|uniref:hypothetical protein n=1 Tax=Moorena sp. SIO3A2 TaxID=2607841 RepID=UPI0013B79760|nr:hypothetical protein [Moorena sp. SIO3A2]NER88853.1 hypothetical protein [Moorena sp. SIO3A2]
MKKQSRQILLRKADNIAELLQGEARVKSNLNTKEGGESQVEKTGTGKQKGVLGDMPDTVSFKDLNQEAQPQTMTKIVVQLNKDEKDMRENLEKNLRAKPQAMLTKREELVQKMQIKENFNAFKEDAQSYDQMRNFITTAKSLDQLNEKSVKSKGYKGIIHFGNNNTIKKPGSLEPVVVAAKGQAKSVYGGAELNWQNTQAELKILNNTKNEITKKVQYARKVNNAQISLVRLERALANNEVIYFHLNMFNKDIIKAILTQNENYQVDKFNPVKESVTAQELYHIYKHWDLFQGNVVFFRNLEPVVPPWYIMATF